MPQKKIKGYKVFNSDWTCRGFQYEVGKTYEMDKKPSLCAEGFHFCTNIADCFKYYSKDTDNKIAEVVALGQVDGPEGDCSKLATNKLKIVKEISWQKAYEVGNQGKNNTGFGNTGYSNTGDWNTGNRNTGNSNTGSYNSGNYCTGLFNTIEQPMYLFNQPTDFTREEFRNIFPEQHSLLFCSDFSLTEWIYEGDMSDEEKENNPSYKTSGGYLKQKTYQEAWAEVWSDWDKKERESIKKLPNFDPKIFEEITGIKI